MYQLSYGRKNDSVTTIRYYKNKEDLNYEISQILDRDGAEYFAVEKIDFTDLKKDMTVSDFEEIFGIEITEDLRFCKTIEF